MEGIVRSESQVTVQGGAAPWPLVNATGFSELRYDAAHGEYHFWANLRNDQVVMFNQDAAELNGCMQENNPQANIAERLHGYNVASRTRFNGHFAHPRAGSDQTHGWYSANGQLVGIQPVNYPTNVPNLYSDPSITNIKSPISIMHEMQQKYQISIDFKMTTNQAKRNEHYCTLYLRSCDMEVYAFGCGYRAALAKQQAAAHMLLRLVESNVLHLCFFPGTYLDAGGTVYFGFDSVALKRRRPFKKTSVNRAHLVPLNLSFDITARIVNNLLLSLYSYRRCQNTFFCLSEAEQDCWDPYRRGLTGTAIYVAQAKGQQSTRVSPWKCYFPVHQSEMAPELFNR